MKVTIINFTDPMMGLSYECEPIFRKLETHFAGVIEFKFVMSLLVRNVYELVNPRDLEISKAVAIKNYNAKLAKIYESEESLGGLPIVMDGFNLFSETETSSLPLNLAYKAAQLADAARAALFLYNLRYATIVDCRPTTKFYEILKVVEKTKIDTAEFEKHFRGTTALEELKKDLEFTQQLELRTLPSYIIQFGEEGILAQGLISYEDFLDLISQVTRGAVKPSKVEKSLDALKNLIKLHPLISVNEILAAFDFENFAQVEKFIAPMVDSGEVSIFKVKDSFFIDCRKNFR